MIAPFLQQLAWMAVGIVAVATSSHAQPGVDLCNFFLSDIVTDASFDCSASSCQEDANGQLFVRCEEVCEYCQNNEHPSDPANNIEKDDTYCGRSSLLMTLNATSDAVQALRVINTATSGINVVGPFTSMAVEQRDCKPPVGDSSALDCETCVAFLDDKLCDSCAVSSCSDGRIQPLIDCSNLIPDSNYSFCPEVIQNVPTDSIFAFWQRTVITPENNFDTCFIGGVAQKTTEPPAFVLPPSITAPPVSFPNIPTSIPTSAPTKAPSDTTTPQEVCMGFAGLMSLSPTFDCSPDSCQEVIDGHYLIMCQERCEFCQNNEHPSDPANNIEEDDTYCGQLSSLTPVDSTTGVIDDFSFNVTVKSGTNVVGPFSFMTITQSDCKSPATNALVGDCATCSISVDDKLCSGCKVIQCADGNLQPQIDCSNLIPGSVLSMCPEDVSSIPSDSIFAYFQRGGNGTDQGFGTCFVDGLADGTTRSPTTTPTMLPTTMVPTTMVPTTMVPTTMVPTTMVPTTVVPTTVVPTTVVPTTVVPTTVVPTTVVPTTVVPTTVVPTSMPTSAPTKAPSDTTTPQEVCMGFAGLMSLSPTFDCSPNSCQEVIDGHYLIMCEERCEFCQNNEHPSDPANNIEEDDTYCGQLSSLTPVDSTTGVIDDFSFNVTVKSGTNVVGPFNFMTITQSDCKSPATDALVGDCATCSISVDDKLCSSCNVTQCADGNLQPQIDCSNLIPGSVFSLCPEDVSNVPSDSIFAYFQRGGDGPDQGFGTCFVDGLADGTTRSPTTTPTMLPTILPTMLPTAMVPTSMPSNDTSTELTPEEVCTGFVDQISPDPTITCSANSCQQVIDGEYLIDCEDRCEYCQNNEHPSDPANGILTNDTYCAQISAMVPVNSTSGAITESRTTITATSGINVVGPYASFTIEQKDCISPGSNGIVGDCTACRVVVDGAPCTSCTMTNCADGIPQPRFDCRNIVADSVYSLCEEDAGDIPSDSIFAYLRRGVDAMERNFETCFIDGIAMNGPTGSPDMAPTHAPIASATPTAISDIVYTVQIDSTLQIVPAVQLGVSDATAAAWENVTAVHILASQPAETTDRFQILDVVVSLLTSNATTDEPAIVTRRLEGGDEKESTTVRFKTTVQFQADSAEDAEQFSAQDFIFAAFGKPEDLASYTAAMQGSDDPELATAQSTELLAIDEFDIPTGEPSGMPSGTPTGSARPTEPSSETPSLRPSAGPSTTPSASPEASSTSAPTASPTSAAMTRGGHASSMLLGCVMSWMAAIVMVVAV